MILKILLLIYEEFSLQLAEGSSMNQPGAGSSSLVRPGGPIKASHSANMSLSKANTSGIPKSGLQRPTLLRQGDLSKFNLIFKVWGQYFVY